MNLIEWHEIRDEILRVQNPFRLDCLNPFSALERWRLKATSRRGEPAELLATFRSTFGLHADTNIVLTKGIRSFLRSAMKSPWGRNAFWFIPGDVFPAYREIAKDNGVAYSQFVTWPKLRLDLPTGPDTTKILLLPIPHSPTGKLVEESEIEEIRSWLKHAPNRYVLLDCVYAYEPLLPFEFKKLLDVSPNVIAACSMSKAWLQRCLAGYAAVPNGLFEELSHACETPIPEECALVLECLKSQSTLPGFQAEQFKNQWLRLRPTIRKACPHWEFPISGYLSTVEVRWEELLERYGILAVPPALFGSTASELSIISCLHDLADT